MGHGRTLVNIEKKEDQITLYEKIIGENLSVRDTERAVRAYQEGSTLTQGAKKSRTSPIFAKKASKELTDHLSAKVTVNASDGGKGRITIPFNSEDEFNRIKKIIVGE
jgi:ParB family chromosome partitioning protein